MTREIVCIAGAGLAAMVLIGVLKQYSPAVAAAASLGAAALIFLAALQMSGPVFDFLNRLAQSTDANAFSCLIRAAAVALIAQFAQDSCRENGQTALAGQIEFAGKLGVLLAASPMLEEMAAVLLRFLQ